MMHNQTIENLKELKLFGMVEALEEQERDPRMQAASFHERLGHLVDRQRHYQDNALLGKLLKAAHLKFDACPEDINFNPTRGLDESYVRTLLTCDWIKLGHPLLLTGATGAGKTWLACAFAHQAARKGFTVRFWRLQRLFEELEDVREEGNIRVWRARIAKIKLLILDDWGLADITADRRRELLEIIDDRVGNSGLIITSQLPVDQWHRYLGDPTYADSILDRFVHCAHRLQLRGDTLRKQLVLPPTAKEGPSHDSP